jgi:hypothetical protein
LGIGNCPLVISLISFISNTFFQQTERDRVIFIQAINSDWAAIKN